MFDVETTVDPVAIHRRIGYIPGEFALYDRLTGGQTIQYFANLRGGVDAAYQARPRRAAGHRPEPQVQGVSRATSRRSAWSSRSSTGRSCWSSTSPRPASTRSSSRRSTSWSARRRAEGRSVFLSSHILSEVETHLRPGRDHPRRRAGQGRPHRGPARPRPPPGGAAVRRRHRPGRRVLGPAGRVGRRASRTTRSGCGSRPDHAGRPGRGPLRAARLREPRAVLEETFLAQYGTTDGAAEASLRRWRHDRRRRPARAPFVPPTARP